MPVEALERMSRTVLSIAATPDRLDALLKAGVLTPAQHTRAVSLAIGTPGPDAWRRFAARASLALGAACMLFGLVFFIAWNWEGLPRFAQFAALEVLMVAAAFLSARAPDTFARQLALTFAAVVLGPLLAAYGQTYQTGADPYELFLTWALLAAPLAFVARFRPLWMIIVLLLNVSLALFCEQVRPFEYDPLTYQVVLLGALNGALWPAAELAWGAKSRWPSRVLALGAVLPPLPVAMLYASGEHLFHFEDWGLAAMGLCLSLSAVAALVYRRRRLDLFMLSVAAFGVSFVLAAALWRVVGTGHLWDDDLHWHLAELTEGVFFVAAATAAVAWIRRRRTEALS
jgi:uncharacterized membrane protein